MQLSMDALSKNGGFAGGPVKRRVEWYDHNTKERVNADIWVRPLSFYTVMQDAESDAKQSLVARRIAASICDEDGAPIFRVADITGINDDGTPIMVKDENGKKVERGPLNKELTDNLLAAIAEVSGLGKTETPKK